MMESDKFWDKVAERYAQRPVSDEATYQRKLSETQSFFTPDMRILEFDCGTGTTAISHAPHVQQVDAIDISFMLTEAELANEVANAGFTIESQWRHGIKNIAVSMIARKI